MDVIQCDAFAVFNSSDRRLRSKASAEDALSGARREVLLRSPAGMVAVGVRNDSPLDGKPGIDMKVTGLAV